jgi:hypothetical protein
MHLRSSQLETSAEARGFALIATLSIMILLVMMASCMADVITIEDSKGRSMLVDLLAGNDKSVKIKRLKDGKVFSMLFSSLSEKSKKEIKEKLKTLKPEYPPLEVDVVIGKRSNSKSGSDYKTITAKITVTNKSIKIQCPPCHCKIIFVGESQTYKDRFKLLINESFVLVPTDRGTMFEIEPFIASSYKYKGYLLVVSDDEGRVLLTKTLLPEIKKAVATQANFVSKFIEYQEGAYLSESMLEEESSGNKTIRIR